VNTQGILYVRVSSEDQLRGVSLDDQTNAGRAWFASQLPDVEVVVFREEGESARSAKRTKLDAALRYIAKHPGRVTVFAVYDLSRFARNLYDQLSIERFLAESGVRLVSITQPLPDGPEGEFFSGQIGLMNQYLNRKQGEKISRCMVETVRQGRWPHAAPLGYVNTRDDEGRKVVVPDPEKAELVRAVFERVAAGDGLRAVLRWATERGLRSRHGNPIRPQDFRKLLENPFYRGAVRSVRHGVERDGGHEAIVDATTWSRVQARLAGPSRRSGQVLEQADFPLRGFVSCAHCGRLLTASHSRSKTGRRYGYYACWLPSCSRVRTRAEALEEIVAGRLGELAVAPKYLRALALALEARWRAADAEDERATAAARRRLEALERKRQNLAESYALERAIDLATHDRLRRRLEGEISQVNLELSTSGRPAGDLVDLLRFAEPYLTGLSGAWLSADGDRKRRLQRLVWPAGATFDGKQLGTPVTARIFRVFEAKTKEGRYMVEQISDSWNSLVEWLEDFCAAVAA